MYATKLKNASTNELLELSNTMSKLISISKEVNPYSDLPLPNVTNIRGMYFCFYAEGGRFTGRLAYANHPKVEESNIEHLSIGSLIKVLSYIYEILERGKTVKISKYNLEQLIKDRNKLKQLERLAPDDLLNHESMVRSFAPTQEQINQLIED